jgi:hypothetical protein
MHFLRFGLSSDRSHAKVETSSYMAPGKMCFGKKAEDPNIRKNEEIEKIIRADRRKQEREVKLLLLGMGHDHSDDNFLCTSIC